MNIDTIVRKGIKDVWWRPYMVAGAKFSKNDIPFCPTTAKTLPAMIITYKEAKEIYARELRRGNKWFNGFAQNLANKLNVPVQAPTDILWATPKGKYYVTAGKTINGRLVEDRSVPGTFRTFYPQRRKKK